MIPLGMVVGLILSRVHLYLVPRVYESEVIIQIMLRSESSMEKQAIEPAVEPQYMTSAEFEPLRSTTIFLKVSEKLGLEASWGVDEKTVLKRLKDAVQVSKIRDSDLKRVKVSSTDPVEARDIARELVKTYGEWRKELEQESSDRMLSEIRRVVREEEGVVEECRKTLEITEKEKTNETVILERDILEANRNPEQHSAIVEQLLDREILKREILFAKRNLEQHLDILEQLKSKLAREEMGARLIENRVVIHEEPEIPNNPVGMSERLIMLIWMVGVALLAPLLALPIMSFLNRRRRLEQV